MSVYDAIHKRHQKFVMNQQISCSGMKALRPVWGDVLRVPHDRMLGVYNEARASVRVYVEQMLILLWSSVRERRFCSSCIYVCTHTHTQIYIYIYIHTHTHTLAFPYPSTPPRRRQRFLLVHARPVLPGTVFLHHVARLHPVRCFFFSRGRFFPHASFLSVPCEHVSGFCFFPNVAALASLVSRGVRTYRPHSSHI